jgi:peptidoglycan/xylan/chitin deacetylase (PgdA/CDA1 family)
MNDSSRFLELLRKEQDSWFLYTRKREYQSENLDHHGRYVYDGSIDGDISIPRNSTILNDAGFDPVYPEGKEFTIVLTHDVDLLYPSMKRAIISSSRCLIKGDLSGSVRYLDRGRKGIESSPYNNFEDIMRLEEELDARSTFFFMMAEKDFTGAGYGRAEVGNAIQVVAERGWDVGLHGSYHASEDLSRMVEEKKALERILGKEVQGYRNHFLRLRVPLTWRCLEDAGFTYDSTLGYAERYGFRNGMAHPFRPFDLDQGREIGILELPLALMDCTLYSYMGFTPAESKQVIAGLMSQVSKVKGILVVLWHNDVLADPRYKEWAALYRYILEEGRRKNAWLCSAGELVEWWMKDEASTAGD